QRRCVDGNTRFFRQEAFAARKIESVKAEVTAFRIGQGHAGSIALHHAADVTSNLTEQVTKLQVGNYAVGQIQHELEPVFLARKLRLSIHRSLEIQGAVDG